MPKQADVTLGGRTYTIREKVMGQNLAWRKQLQRTSVIQVFERLDGLIDDLVSLSNSVPEGGGLGDVDFGKAIELGRIVPAMMAGLLNSVDDVWELLFQYEPKLRTDKKWLMENAYDEEGVTAFIEVLKLTYPILALWGVVRGSRVQQTQSSLPSTNGVSGLPASGPKKKVSTSS